MLPSKIRVKLLSEAAGYITVSHVVQRDFSLPELVEIMLPVLGKDAGRIRQILQAGTICTGDYRYRWDSLEVAEQELDSVLDRLPGPDPSRAFEPDRCYLLRFRRGQESLDFSRESLARRPLFAWQSYWESFWEGLVDSFGEDIRYADYSYADKADVFACELSADGRKQLEDYLLPLLRPKSSAGRLARFQPERIEWLMHR